MARFNAEGIDVSFAQTTIDWKKVKESGVTFAMIRVGWCYNNGKLKVDNMFYRHINGALDAGLDVGVYLYSYATSPEAAKRAAQEVLQVVKPYKLSYPIAFDIEYENIYTSATPKANSAIVDAFCSEIEKNKYYAMIYASKDFLMRLLDMKKLARYDVWCAQYASKCTYPNPYGIWQYVGDKGRVFGVSGACDRNVSYKNYPAIMKANHLNRW